MGGELALVLVSENSTHCCKQAQQRLFRFPLLPKKKRLWWPGHLICMGEDDPAGKSIRAMSMTEREDVADPALYGVIV